MKSPVAYRTVEVDGLSIFYREAGRKGAPTLLLLHGLPSSSRMFEPLFSRLSDRYHLVAPDYPGFGHSDWPDPRKFAYTFDHLASVTEHVTEALGISKYTLYMQDYGGPVGFRLAFTRASEVRTARRACREESGGTPHSRRFYARSGLPCSPSPSL
jgi:pimeloyl-ACP methyl ester carboxylesterase